jgi:hypothetical protein
MVRNERRPELTSSPLVRVASDRRTSTLKLQLVDCLLVSALVGRCSDEGVYLVGCWLIAHI